MVSSSWWCPTSCSSSELFWLPKGEESAETVWKSGGTDWVPRDSRTASRASVRWLRMLSHSYNTLAAWDSHTRGGSTYSNLPSKLGALLLYAFGDLGS